MISPLESSVNKFEFLFVDFLWFFFVVSVWYQLIVWISFPKWISTLESKQLLAHSSSIYNWNAFEYNWSKCIKRSIWHSIYCFIGSKTNKIYITSTIIFFQLVLCMCVWYLLFDKDEFDFQQNWQRLCTFPLLYPRQKINRKSLIKKTFRNDIQAKLRYCQCK